MNKFKNQFPILFFVIMLLMIQSCTQIGGPSPSKQMLTIHDMYNAQYADYMVTTGYVNEQGFWIKKSSPVLSEEKKEVLRKKKLILTEVYPLIKLYDDLVFAGDTPPPDLLPRIFLLLESIL